MTVHGAKGLEAPIVFLPDTCRATGGRGVGPMFRFDDGFGSPLVWAQSKASDCAATAALRADAERRRDEEANRLLYVAMTRARDRLYVAGFRTNTNRLPDGAWYDLVSDGLAPILQTVETPDGAVRRYVEPGAAAEPRPPRPESDAAPDMPDWLTRDAPRERPPAAPLAPSRLADHAGAGQAAAAGRKAAMRRGTILHRLLEALPGIAPGNRRAAGERALALLAADWPEDQRTAALGEVLAILDNPDFAPVFAPGSLAEAGVAGRLSPAAPSLSGQIDRIRVTDTEVLIVDYKTDRAVPAGPEAVPPAYLAQLSAYAALAQAIWPGRRVRAALLWTAAPRLMELPAGVLATHGDHASA